MFSDSITDYIWTFGISRGVLFFLMSEDHVHISEAGFMQAGCRYG